MFCTNCGAAIPAGARFCPTCGVSVAGVAATPVTTARAVQPVGVVGDDTVMLLSRGTCTVRVATDLISDLCGYTDAEAAQLIKCAPVTLAQGLTDTQAMYLAQALTEYGMEVSVYDGRGYRELNCSYSVFDTAGGLLADVAAALGLISAVNRVSYANIRRVNYPYGYTGPRPPMYRSRIAPRPITPRRYVRPVPPPPPRGPHMAPPPPPRGPHAPMGPARGPHTPTPRPMNGPVAGGPHHGPMGGPMGPHDPHGPGGHGPHGGGMGPGRR